DQDLPARVAIVHHFLNVLRGNAGGNQRPALRIARGQEQTAILVLDAVSGEIEKKQFIALPIVAEEYFHGFEHLVIPLIQQYLYVVEAANLRVTEPVRQRRSVLRRTQQALERFVGVLIAAQDERGATLARFGFGRHDGHFLSWRLIQASTNLLVSASATF